MKNPFYLVVFVLAVALAYAVSQTAPAAAPQQQASPGSSQPASNPSSHDEATMPDANAPDKDKAADKSVAADSDIQKQVQQQMATNSFNAVAVSVEKGVVTLSGAVASKEDRKRARELAKAVAGVQDVKEKLIVDAAASTALPVLPTAAPGSSPAGAATVGSTESQQNTSGSIAGNTTAVSGTQAGSATTQPSASAQTTTTTTTTTTQPSASAQTGTTSTGGVTGQATDTTGQSTGVSGSATGVTGASTGASGSATGVTGQSTGVTGTTSGTSATGTTSSTMTTEQGGDVQGRIENAIKAEPTLTGSNVMVNVTGDTVELSGSVPTGKEKQTANRIASSFAGNLKVVDRITVTGRGVNSTTPPPSTDQSQQAPQTPKH